MLVDRATAHYIQATTEEINSEAAVIDGIANRIPSSLPLAILMYRNRGGILFSRDVVSLETDIMLLPVNS